MKFIEYLDILDEKNNSSDSIFKKMINWHIPLSPKMLERIFVVNKEEFFHVTDLTNRKKLEKLQGSRKTVSCFTDFNSEDIFTGADGIDYKFPAVFTLRGSYTFGSSEDVYTEPDSGGRRWIEPQNIMDPKSEELFREISLNIMNEFLKSSFGKDYTKEQLDLLFSEHDKIDKKEKALIIKTYLDISEKVLKKFKDDILYLFDRDTKKYNEILGYNFKIQSIKMHEYNFFNYLMYKHKNTPPNFYPDGDEEDKLTAYKIAKEMNIELFDSLDNLIDSL